MSRCSRILTACLLLAVFAWSQAAFSYTRSSQMDYGTVGTHVLSGYSRTQKDLLDPDYADWCGWSEWEDPYGYVCVAEYESIYYARADSDLYAPTGFYETTSYVNLYDASATHAHTITTEIGTWSETGHHIIQQDTYVNYCPYYFCGGWVYVGTYTSSAGSNTSAQWAVIPLTVSRYSSVTLSDSDVDTILASANNILQTNNGGTDVACQLSFDRYGSVGTFSSYGVITDDTQATAVYAEPARVKVVIEMNYCGGSLDPSTIGCTRGQKTILERITGEGSLWAHEYGHTQGLSDNFSQTGFVMSNPFSTTNNVRLTSSECSTMMTAPNG